VFLWIDILRRVIVEPAYQKYLPMTTISIYFKTVCTGNSSSV